MGDRPNRLVDDLANGLLPGPHPSSVGLTVPNAKSDDPGALPTFMLGDPNNPDTRKYVTKIEFDKALAVAGMSNCAFGGTTGRSFDNEALWSSATLTGLAFNPVNGHFYQDLQLFKLDVLNKPNATHDITYSANQNANYLTTSGQNGATSSLDTVVNTAEIEATTTARPGVNGLKNADGKNAGDVYYAHDTSEASVTGEASSIEKYVLKNDKAVVDPAVPGAKTIWELDYGPNAATDPEAPDFA